MLCMLCRHLICSIMVLLALHSIFINYGYAETENKEPIIKILSQPVTEIGVDIEYLYQIELAPGESRATAQYLLLKTPKGMTISKDGLVKWKTRMADIGDHVVSIRIKKAPSMEVIQTYFVTVTAPWTKQSPIRALHYTDSAQGKRVFRVGVLMINTLPNPVADNPKSPRLEFYTPEKLGHLFFNHVDGGNSFIREASHGRVALQGTVVGWLEAPKKGVNAKDIINDTNYYFGLAKEHMDFSQYDVFVVHALAEGEGQQTGWLYPQQSVKTPQGIIKNIGLIWMINSDVFDMAPLEYTNWSSGDAVLPTTSWSHEFLHTFGINGHANSFDCGDKTLTTAGGVNPIKAYGGVFSIMGEHAFACHPDVLMKSRLGWIEKEQFPTITKSGNYDIYPLETPDQNSKGLFIPVTPEISHAFGQMVFDGFVVEYREPIGFDRYLKRLDGSPFLERYKSAEKVDRNGVIIYMKYKANDTDGTVLLDMNPDTTFNANRGIKLQGNVGKFADAILTVNKTFTHNNVSITPIGLNDKGAMRVTVKIDN